MVKSISCQQDVAYADLETLWQLSSGFICFFAVEKIHLDPLLTFNNPK